MRLSDRNPAIYAGLLGVGMWLDPVPALAMQVPHAAEKLTVPWTQIGVGCLAGAAISGAVYLGVSLVSNHLDSLEGEDEQQEGEPVAEPASAHIIPVDTEELQRQRASLFEESDEELVSAEVTDESQAVLPVPDMIEEPMVEAPAIAEEQAPTLVELAPELGPAVKGRHMASSKAAGDALPAEGKVSLRRAAHAKVLDETNVPRAEASVPKASGSGPKRFRTSPEASPKPDGRSAAHFKPAPEAPVRNEVVRKAPRFKSVVPAEGNDIRPSKAAHYKVVDAPRRASKGPRFKTVEPAAQEAQKPSKTPRFKAVAPTGRAADPAHFKGTDVVKDVAKEAGSVVTAAAVDSAKNQAQDYTEIAEKYVKKTTLAARVAARAAGVANVLSARVKADMFDDLPIISRSDGTVGDVGTSWWDTAMGDSVRRVTDIANEDLDVEAVSIQSSQSLVTGSSLGRAAYASSVPRATKTDGAKRSAYISKNVAEVRLGMYPEHRTAEELDHDDIWERALRAMGERIEREHGMMPAPTPVFVDLVGDVDTLDEVDGLDGDTNFIPFKKPAGHPEVVDSSSYVNYLIDDEFSKNSSPAVRKSSADYLRVIRGGSQKSRPLPAQRLRGEHVPKHFAGRGSSMALVGA